MRTVLEEVTSETLDVEHVRRRVDEWEERVNGLYEMIGNWLPDGWKARHGRPVIMHAELMKKYGIGQREMPTLVLSRGTDDDARLEPRGLWIIYSNGRVDLKRNGRHYLIHDMADIFQPVDWQAAPSERRGECEAVSEEWLRSVLD